MTENKESNNDLSSPFGGQGAVYYCYDALCGWCYGFSPVMKKIEQEYKDQVSFDVLSGGMIMPD
ncbi:MAG TPA: hypothetical protein VNA26_01410, partial [Chitinophagaceae bacterium]|nr:hypothetical protein [Chitinophagaceae bacterium]